MKQTTLETLEFSLNTCMKTYLIEGQQPSFDILVSNGYPQVVDEVCELMERGIVTSEFDMDFCKKMLAMHGSKVVIEDHIHKLEDKHKSLEKMNVKRDIRLSKPL